MESLVDFTYEQFKNRVMLGRSLDAAKVESVARGRVWSGKRAKENGLVDSLGGLQDAIQDARNKAGIRPGAEVELIEYRSDGSLLGMLSPLLAKAQVTAPPPLLPQLADSFGPTWVMATHPETTVWLMDPSLPIRSSTAGERPLYT